jgi:hypothetical protein
MKQMKIKKPDNFCDVKIESSHIVNEDDITGELEIEEFSLKFKGNLSEWLFEYLNNPVGSKLHKELVNIFSGWFEEE